MNTYIFKIEDNILKCTKNTQEVPRTYTGITAENRLRMLDNNKYTKVKIDSTAILIENAHVRLYISNEVLFGKNNYQYCLHNNLGRIKNHITRQTKKRVNNKRIVPGTYKGIATAGVLVAIALAATSLNVKDSKLVNNDVVEYLNDDLESISPDKIMTNKSSILNEFPSKNIQLNETPTNDNKTPINDNASLTNNSVTDLLDELESDTSLVTMSFDDSFDQVKFKHVYDNYYDAINERATRWGVSTNLVLSILSQESGGYEDNLMQIEWNAWADEPIIVFNFEKGEYEKIVLTENPENFEGQNVTQFISKAGLMNPKTNISIGCIILRYCFDQMHHNVTAAIQAYNFGVNNMLKVLNTAAQDKGCTIDDLLNNQNDTSYLDYRCIIDVGDPHYVENTLRFLQDPEEPISIKYIDDAGTPQETSIIIDNERTSKSL